MASQSVRFRMDVFHKPIHRYAYHYTTDAHKARHQWSVDGIMSLHRARSFDM